jgi:hypothetical protein
MRFLAFLLGLGYKIDRGDIGDRLVARFFGIPEIFLR